ncbi:MAG: CBS domain-containing protein [Actinomycetota bacterium]
MPANTLVRDIMTAHPVTLRPDVSVAAAAGIFAEKGFGAMPVVDENGHLLGLLRDDDLIVTEARIHAPAFLNFLGAVIPLPGEMRHFEEEIHKVAGSTVGEAMDDDPPTIGADETLEDLATLMHERGESHVPVVAEEGRVVGIVARGDVVRYIARTS